MTRPARERKKIFSHKVRSGCDSCKRRHIKCGEEKPVCVRCKKAGFQCEYSIPKARLFEINTPDDSEELVPFDSKLYNRQKDDGFSFLNPAPGSGFGTLGDRRALEYWMTTTAPWLARYVPRTHSALWLNVLPRCAHLLPATRHLLIAVAMLDQRYHGLDPPAMMVRARTILDHYNNALNILTGNSVEPLDLFLSPILAWIIEIMVNNPNIAIMHIKHSRKMLEGVPTKPHNSNDTEDIVQEFVKDTAQFCSGFTSTSAACAGILSGEPCSIFQMLNVRESFSTDTSTEEVRQAIYKYAGSLDKDGRTSFPPKEALDYLRHWESRSLVRRFVQREAPDTIVATHFLIATATTLLVPQDERGQDTFYRQDEAWNYLLIKLEDCLNVEGLPLSDRQGLDDAVAFALSLIGRYAKTEKFRAKAVQLMARTNPSSATGLYWMHWVGKSPSVAGSETASGSSDRTKATTLPSPVSTPLSEPVCSQTPAG